MTYYEKSVSSLQKITLLAPMYGSSWGGVGVAQISGGDKNVLGAPPHIRPGSGSVCNNHNLCKSVTAGYWLQSTQVPSREFIMTKENMKRFSNMPDMESSMTSATGVTRRGQILT